MATFTVPATGTYEDSVDGGKYRYTAGVLVDLAWAVRLGMPGAALPADPAPFSDAQVDYLEEEFEPGGEFAATDHTHEPETQARTATADGTGTGTISESVSGSVFVPVTSANANHIITLPDADAGAVVALRNGATGYELRTHAPATVAINGGTGAGAESAIPANTLTVCVHDTATTWLCTDQATTGSVVTTEIAAA